MNDETQKNQKQVLHAAAKGYSLKYCRWQSSRYVIDPHKASSQCCDESQLSHIDRRLVRTLWIPLSTIFPCAWLMLWILYKLPAKIKRNTSKKKMRRKLPKKQTAVRSDDAAAQSCRIVSSQHLVQQPLMTPMLKKALCGATDLWSDGSVWRSGLQTRWFYQFKTFLTRANNRY